MVNIRVVEKATGRTVAQSGDDVLLRAPSVVTVGAAPQQIVSVARNGNRLGMRFDNGDAVTIDNFFDAKGKPVSELVVRDDAGGGSWLGVYSAQTGEVTLAPADAVAVNAGPAAALESTTEMASAQPALDVPPASASVSPAAPAASIAEAGSMLPLVAFSVAGIGMGVGAAWVATRHDSDDSAPSVRASNEHVSADLAASDFALASNDVPVLAGTVGPAPTAMLTQPDSSTAITIAGDDGSAPSDPNPAGDAGQRAETAVAADGQADAPVDNGPADTTDTTDTTETTETTDATDTPDATPPAALDSTTLNLVDDTAEVPATIARGATTGDAQPAFSGHVDGGEVASVNVYDNGALIGNAAVDGAGDWSFEPALPLAGGAHDFEAAPVDAAGNEGPKTDGWSFSVEDPAETTANALTLDNLLSDDAATQDNAAAADSIASTLTTLATPTEDLLTAQQSQQPLI